MYPIILAAHNILRWVVMILLIITIVRAYLGWFGKRKWTERDRKFGVFTGVALDVQFLLGLLLYFFFSPLTRTALQNFGQAMQVADVRFFALEHVLYMILAVVFAHLASVFARKAVKPEGKHKLAAIWFSLAFLMIIMGMPWMRPLLPGLG